MNGGFVDPILPRQGADPTCTARRQIDKEIQVLKEQIRKLKSKRNDLSPISVLPPEVLVKIFIFLRDLTGESYGRTTGRNSWIRVGHICRYWRDVALSCPTLWSIPSFTNANLAQVMLERSKNAELTIIAAVNTWTPKMKDQLEAAIAQFHRIKSLELTFVESSSANAKTIIEAFSHPAPFLQRLSLTQSYSSYGTDTLILPHDAFKHSPLLRDVRLHQVALNWDSCFLRQGCITHLSLGKLDQAFLPTLSQLMDVLQTMVNSLELLELKQSVPSYTTNDSFKGRTLHLRALTHLSVDSSCLNIASFLRCIQWSSRTAVAMHITCTSPSEDFSRYNDIFSIVGDNQRRGTPRFPQGMELYLSGPDVNLKLNREPLDSSDCFCELNMSNSTTNRGGSYRTVLINIDMEVRHSRGHSELPFEQVLANMCKSFELSHIKFLKMCLPSGEDHHHLVIRNCLGRLPRLKTVHLIGQFRPFCLAVKEPLDDSVVTIQQKSSLGNQPFSFPSVTVFPALKNVTIRGGNFSSETLPENMASLENMLMQRCDMDAPIDYIGLVDGDHLRRFHFERLGELVPNVKFNGAPVKYDEFDSFSEDTEEMEEEEEEDYYDYEEDYHDYEGTASDLFLEEDYYDGVFY